MKKLFFALLFCGIGSMYAQTVTTTEEEYNYLTKGYPESIEKGLDIKAGYKLEKFYERKADVFEFKYYSFIEISTNKTKAILVTGKKEKGKDDKLVYMCIPFNNQDLMKRSIVEKNNGVSMTILIDTINYVLLSKTLNLLQNNPTGKLE